MSDNLIRAHSEAFILHVLASMGKLTVHHPPGKQSHYDEAEAAEIRKRLAESRQREAASGIAIGPG